MKVRSRLLLVLGLCLPLIAAACDKDSNTTVTNPTCSFTAAPATATFAPEGGAGSVTVTVTAGSGCTWTATSNAAFVTISSGASGTGNGTVQFAVGANGGAERTATLTVAGLSVAITQRAAAAPPPPPGPVTLSAPSAVSPIGAQVLAPGRPTLVVNNSTSTGNVGTVTYRFELSELGSFPDDPGRTFVRDGVAQGAGGTTSWLVDRDLGAGFRWFWRARSTNGTVTSDYSNVESFSISAPCSYALSATSVAANPGGASLTFNVTTGNACSWSAISNDAFIAITSTPGNAGTGTVSFTVAANGGGPRIGTITVSFPGGSLTFTVTQDGGCTYNPSPNSMTFTNAAFAGQTFVVDTSSATCAWAASSDSTWLVITGGDTNTGRATVTYSVQPNATGSQRIGNINITGAISGSAVFVVTQQP